MVDIYIFDGPSALNSADAALLAPHVDGAVLVVSPKSDRREDIERSKERLLHNKSARLLGAVTFTGDSSANAGTAPKQLPAPEMLVLPPASEPSKREPSGVIVTPPPESSGDAVEQGNAEDDATPGHDTPAAVPHKDEGRAGRAHRRKRPRTTSFAD
jgi:hypothetical protein